MLALAFNLYVTSTKCFWKPGQDKEKANANEERTKEVYSSSRKTFSYVAALLFKCFAFCKGKHRAQDRKKTSKQTCHTSLFLLALLSFFQNRNQNKLPLYPQNNILGVRYIFHLHPHPPNRYNVALLHSFVVCARPFHVRRFVSVRLYHHRHFGCHPIYPRKIDITFFTKPKPIILENHYYSHRFFPLFCPSATLNALRSLALVRGASLTQCGSFSYLFNINTNTSHPLHRLHSVACIITHATIRAFIHV